MKKLAAYALPVLAFVSILYLDGCKNSNYAKKRIPGTKYVFIKKNTGDRKKDYNLLQSEINILLNLAKYHSITLEDICNEADINKDKRIDQREYMMIMGKLYPLEK